MPGTAGRYHAGYACQGDGQMINRLLEGQILNRLHDSKVLLLYGGRQVGKSSILRKVFNNRDDVLWLNGDEPEIRQLFSSQDSHTYRNVLKEHPVVVIDEAHRIDDIGLTLKLIHDTIPSVKVIATGSSDFRLYSSTTDALAGRKWEMSLGTLSFEELLSVHGRDQEINMLAHRIIYGSYPELVTCQPGDEQQLLVQLADSFLTDEVLNTNDHSRRVKILRLLRMLARKVGQELLMEELQEETSLDAQDIEHLLYYFENSNLLFVLSSYPGELWNEEKHAKRYYFSDNGIRNAILLNFADVSRRKDAAALWQNYLISERRKYLQYHGLLTNAFFWRTRYQQELSYLEERAGTLQGYEFSWNDTGHVTVPQAFKVGYPDAEVTIITPDNYDRFLTGEI